jgi:hypothetical protein
MKTKYLRIEFRRELGSNYVEFMVKHYKTLTRTNGIDPPEMPVNLKPWGWRFLGDIDKDGFTDRYDALVNEAKQYVREVQMFEAKVAGSKAMCDAAWMPETVEF